MNMTPQSTHVPISSGLIVANPIDSRGMKDPYRFRFTDSFMKKDKAPNYYPPVMRRQMNEYMSKTSINFEFQDPLSFKQRKLSKSKLEKIKSPDKYQVPDKKLKKLNDAFNQRFNSLGIGKYFSSTLNQFNFRYALNCKTKVKIQPLSKTENGKIKVWRKDL